MGGKGSAPAPPPPQLPQQDNSMMEMMMSMMQMLPAMMAAAVPETPQVPEPPPIDRPPEVDWKEKQTQLQAKMKADYDAEQRRKKGVQDTVHTSPLLDDMQTVIGSLLGTDEDTPVTGGQTLG